MINPSCSMRRDGNGTMFDSGRTGVAETMVYARLSIALRRKVPLAEYEMINPEEQVWIPRVRIREPIPIDRHSPGSSSTTLLRASSTYGPIDCIVLSRVASAPYSNEETSRQMGKKDEKIGAVLVTHIERNRQRRSNSVSAIFMTAWFKKKEEKPLS
ncbi:hypothetical protein BX600DRAFT_429259 [Xylariales sp. PMI_506]|nr:hypothetical protein BX600DRAFT_429259 [Xylariales sp. PMI_506]